METLSFVNFIDFLKTRKKQEEYKSMSSMRSNVNSKFSSTGWVPLNSRPLRLGNSDVYGGKGENRLRYSNCHWYGHTKQQCRKCGKYGHPSHLCWEKKKEEE